VVETGEPDVVFFFFFFPGGGILSQERRGWVGARAADAFGAAMRMWTRAAAR